MGPALCLAYCVEYEGRMPADYRTAIHVKEWIAESAMGWSDTDDEKRAAAAAMTWANKYLSDHQTTEGKGASHFPPTMQLDLDLCA